jgi:hypothetical protein
MLPIARPRTLGLSPVLALVIAACTGSGPSASPSGEAPAASPGAGATTRPSPSPVESSTDAWLAVGRKGELALEVILAGTGERLFALPAGVPREHWGQVITATVTGGSTVVDEVVVQPDLPAWRSRTIEGTWHLPRVGADELPTGLSEDGSTIVLTEDAAAGAAHSRFAVLSDNDAARILELPGALEFDALSADGAILYVVEHLPGPPDAHYQVRAVDLPSGRMRDDVIVDKRSLDESMGGWPITQARHENGVVFTLYRGAKHPFIHALNTNEAWAICLDLPEIGADDATAAADWGLAMSADGATVYAVNATLGLASAIDPGELTFRQTVSFETRRASAPITLAKFGHQDSGPVGRRAVVSPDGASLYAAGSGGIVRLETGRLTVTETLLPGTAVEGLALTPDGSTLYALLGTGRIVKLDAATGEVLGEVDGEGYDRLVAVVPW